MHEANRQWNWRVCRAMKDSPSPLAISPCMGNCQSNWRVPTGWCRLSKARCKFSRAKGGQAMQEGCSAAGTRHPYWRFAFGGGNCQPGWRFVDRVDLPVALAKEAPSLHSCVPCIAFFFFIRSSLAPGVDLRHEFSAEAEQVEAGRQCGRRNPNRQARRWDRPCDTSSRHHRHHNE
ncbi:hypothetical protein GmHk_19G055112 [Glycine max]|nr:hypothetical protein GmHk_19G055112 [Glycine max]